MKKMHCEIEINAPREKVWKIMLAKETYTEWTNVFAEGSSYEGSWEEGSKILFLDPSGQGMVSIIAENREPEFLSIKHIGVIKDGVEDTESEEAKIWAPAFENYTFIDKDGKTLLKIDMDIEEKHEEMFRDMWPRALKSLKEICERE